MARFIATVRKRTEYKRPVLQSNTKPVLIDQLTGKELDKDPETGKYLGEGVPKYETTATDATDDPLVDEAGNPVEAGTAEALLRKVKEHFAREEYENTKVISVTVQEIKTIQEVSGAELNRL